MKLRISWIELLWVGTLVMIAHHAASADSDASWDTRYFTIETAQIEELSSDWDAPEVGGRESSAAAPAATPATSPQVSIGDIVNLGREVWKVVLENAPVMELKASSANAVPRGLDSWFDLEKWQRPQARTYRVLYKNPYGMRVVDFSYRILYTAGGSYQGKGHYLAHITAIPERVEVAWGYRFDARASVPSVTNAGTADEPIAAAELAVEWTVKTPLKASQGSASYYIRGDGQFDQLTGAGF